MIFRPKVIVLSAHLPERGVAALGALLLYAGLLLNAGRVVFAETPKARQQAHLPERGTRDDLESGSVNVGFRKTTFSYRAGDGTERERQVFLWYPTAVEAQRYDYRGQIGLVAPDAAVIERKSPLILFSHGFLGAAEQTIFLMEALAREGYIVAAVNHADSSTPKEKPVAWPDFIDAKSWNDDKYRDRQEDLAALLDYLLAQNGEKNSFLQNRIDKAAVGAAGHSLGGYTVLGMIGGWESWRDRRIKAALLLSPYAAPYLHKGEMADVKTPVMLQGGTLDWGITPFLPQVYSKLAGPKYYLVLKNETHFGWTNLISLGKTTTECVAGGNAELIANYSIDFFNCHLRGDKGGALATKNSRLHSYEHLAE